MTWEEGRGGEGKAVRIDWEGYYLTALCCYYSIFSKASRGGRVGVSIYAD